MRYLLLIAAPLFLVACTGTRTAPPPASPAVSASPRPAPAQPSAEVRDAQQQLHTLGMYDGPVDGIWGPATQEAVQRFQRSHRLNVTSRLDKATLGAIGEAASAPIELSDPTQVRTVQNRLRQLNYYDGPADGIWGTRTQRALEDFQRTRGLPVGQVTGPTLSAMQLNPAEFPRRSASRSLGGDLLSPGVVRNVQQRLRQLGFHKGRADGIWGPATQDALARFQKSRGLEATGSLNPTTASALGLDPNNLSAGLTAPPPRPTVGR